MDYSDIEVHGGPAYRRPRSTTKLVAASLSPAGRQRSIYLPKRVIDYQVFYHARSTRELARSAEELARSTEELYLKKLLLRQQQWAAYTRDLELIRTEGKPGPSIEDQISEECASSTRDSGELADADEPEASTEENQISVGNDSPESQQLTTTAPGTGLAEPVGLLDLPNELLILIFEFTLGDHNIHVKCLATDQGKRFQRTFCQANACFADVYEASTKPVDKEQKSSDPEKNDAKSIPLRPTHATVHEDCLARFGQEQVKKDDHFLALLETCKRFKEAAWKIPFSHNTFSFENVSDLTDFSASLSPPQLQLIKTIHLAAAYENCIQDSPLCSGLTQATVDSLVGLKELRLTVANCVRTTLQGGRPVAQHAVQVKVLMAPDEENAKPQVYHMKSPRQIAYDIERVLLTGLDARDYGWIECKRIRR